MSTDDTAGALRQSARAVGTASPACRLRWSELLFRSRLSGQHDGRSPGLDRGRRVGRLVGRGIPCEPRYPVADLRAPDGKLAAATRGLLSHANSRDVPEHLERDRKSTRLNSSHRCISYAVFCLKKKRRTMSNTLEYSN